MKDYISWLRWWLLFLLIGVGTAVFAYSGFLLEVNKGDITKISFLIYFLFYIFTIMVGKYTYYACGNRKKLPYYMRRIRLVRFVSANIVTLGMIGTVFGFIYMLKMCFFNLDISDVTSTKETMVLIAVGMGTALYTTASGLVCSLLLKIQLYNLENHIERRHEKER